MIKWTQNIFIALFVAVLCGILNWLFYGEPLGVAGSTIFLISLAFNVAWDLVTHFARR